MAAWSAEGCERAGGAALPLLRLLLLPLLLWLLLLGKGRGCGAEKVGCCCCDCRCDECARKASLLKSNAAGFGAAADPPKGEDAAPLIPPPP
jgi:hypothetical protein